jgi:hypothetical protein
LTVRKCFDPHTDAYRFVMPLAVLGIFPFTPNIGRFPAIVERRRDFFMGALKAYAGADDSAEISTPIPADG